MTLVDLATIIKDALVGWAAMVAAYAGVRGLDSWLRQQRWNSREKHYTELLSSLNRLRLSLRDRHGYYAQPGSEHDPTIPEGDGFKESSRIGHEAMQAVQQQFGAASPFLSDSALAALEELIVEQWHVSEFSGCMAEFVEDSLKLADEAYSAILKEAREALTR